MNKKFVKQCLLCFLSNLQLAKNKQTFNIQHPMINGMNETNLSMPLGQFSDTYQRSLNTSLSQTNLIITPERPTQVVQTKVKGVSQLQCLKQCLLSLQLARQQDDIHPTIPKDQ